MLEFPADPIRQGFAADARQPCRISPNDLEPDPVLPVTSGFLNGI
jgi:hypothetical protein